MAPKPIELNTLEEFDAFLEAEVKPLLQDIALEQAAIEQQQVDDKRKKMRSELVSLAPDAPRVLFAVSLNPTTNVWSISYTEPRSAFSRAIPTAISWTIPPAEAQAANLATDQLASPIFEVDTTQENQGTIKFDILPITYGSASDEVLLQNFRRIDCCYVIAHGASKPRNPLLRLLCTVLETDNLAKFEDGRDIVEDGDTTSIDSRDEKL